MIISIRSRHSVLLLKPVIILKKYQGSKKEVDGRKRKKETGSSCLLITWLYDIVFREYKSESPNGVPGQCSNMTKCKYLW